MNDTDLLRALVESLRGAQVTFNNQFAVGLQVKGAARQKKVARLQREFQQALANATTALKNTTQS